MDGSQNAQLLPGDPRLVEIVVTELKSQGIFDKFRKDCIADVDTKPAFQNLKQRVENSVSGFLRQRTWTPQTNKIQLREQLRKYIQDSPYLDKGVERIVDQVVNPKVHPILSPKVEEVVFKFLGLDQKTMKTENTNDVNLDLLPTDLDPISPESENKSSEKSNDDSKEEDDESPPFEPLDAPLNDVEVPNGETDNGESNIDNEDKEKFSEVKTNDDKTNGEKHTNINNGTVTNGSKTTTKITDGDESDNSIDSSEGDRLEIDLNDDSNQLTQSHDNIKSSGNEKPNSKEEKKSDHKRNSDSRHSSRRKSKSHHDRSRKDSETKDSHDRKRKSSETKDSLDRSRKSSESKESRDRTKKSSESKETNEHSKKRGDSKDIKEIRNEKDDKDSKSRHSSRKSDGGKKDDQDDKRKKSENHSKSDDKKKSSRESRSGKSDEKSNKVEEKTNKSDKPEEKLNKNEKSDEKPHKSNDNLDDKSSSSEKHHKSSSRHKHDKHKHKFRNSSHDNKDSRDNSHDRTSKVKEKGENEANKEDSKNEDKNDKKEKKDKHTEKSKTTEDKHTEKNKTVDDKSSRRDKDKKKSKRDESEDDHSIQKNSHSDRRTPDQDSDEGSSTFGTPQAKSKPMLTRQAQRENQEKEKSENSQKKKSTKSKKRSNDNELDEASNNEDETIDENCEDEQKSTIVKSVEVTGDVDNVEQIITDSPASPPMHNDETPQVFTQVSYKLKKPKFASNIFEAMKLKKIRKQLEKIEKEREIQINKALEEKQRSLMADKFNSREAVVEDNITPNSNKEIEQQTELKVINDNPDFRKDLQIIPDRTTNSNTINSNSGIEEKVKPEIPIIVLDDDEIESVGMKINNLKKNEEKTMSKIQTIVLDNDVTEYDSNLANREESSSKLETIVLDDEEKLEIYDNLETIELDIDKNCDEELVTDNFTDKLKEDVDVSVNTEILSNSEPNIYDESIKDLVQRKINSEGFIMMSEIVEGKEIDFIIRNPRIRISTNSVNESKQKISHSENDNKQMNENNIDFTHDKADADDALPTVKTIPVDDKINLASETSLKIPKEEKNKEIVNNSELKIAVENKHIENKFHAAKPIQAQFVETFCDFIKKQNEERDNLSKYARRRTPKLETFTKENNSTEKTDSKKNLKPDLFTNNKISKPELNSNDINSDNLSQKTRNQLPGSSFQSMFEKALGGSIEEPPKQQRITQPSKSPNKIISQKNNLPNKLVNEKIMKHNEDTLNFKSNKLTDNKLNSPNVTKSAKTNSPTRSSSKRISPKNRRRVPHVTGSETIATIAKLMEMEKKGNAKNMCVDTMEIGEFEQKWKQMLSEDVDIKNEERSTSKPEQTNEDKSKETEKQAANIKSANLSQDSSDVKVNDVVKDDKSNAFSKSNNITPRKSTRNQKPVITSDLNTVSTPCNDTSTNQITIETKPEINNPNENAIDSEHLSATEKHSSKVPVLVKENKPLCTENTTPTESISDKLNDIQPKTESKVENVKSSTTCEVNSGTTSKANPDTTKVTPSTAPKINPSTAPKINLSINPKRNSISSKVNISTTPKVNVSITPKFNPIISPKENLSSASKVNFSTDLKAKPSIAPKLNPSITPNVNLNTVSKINPINTTPKVKSLITIDLTESSSVRKSTRVRKPTAKILEYQLELNENINDVDFDDEADDFSTSPVINKEKKHNDNVKQIENVNEEAKMLGASNSNSEKKSPGIKDVTTVQKNKQSPFRIDESKLQKNIRFLRRFVMDDDICDLTNDENVEWRRKSPTPLKKQTVNSLENKQTKKQTNIPLRFNRHSMFKRKMKFDYSKIYERFIPRIRKRPRVATKPVNYGKNKVINNSLKDHSIVNKVATFTKISSNNDSMKDDKNSKHKSEEVSINLKTRFSSRLKQKTDTEKIENDNCSSKLSLLNEFLNDFKVTKLISPEKSENFKTQTISKKESAVGISDLGNTSIKNALDKKQKQIRKGDSRCIKQIESESVTQPNNTEVAASNIPDICDESLNDLLDKKLNQTSEITIKTGANFEKSEENIIPQNNDNNEVPASSMSGSMEINTNQTKNIEIPNIESNASKIDNTEKETDIGNNDAEFNNSGKLDLKLDNVDTLSSSMNSPLLMKNKTESKNKSSIQNELNDSVCGLKNTANDMNINITTIKSDDLLLEEKQNESTVQTMIINYDKVNDTLIEKAKLVKKNKESSTEVAPFEGSKEIVVTDENEPSGNISNGITLSVIEKNIKPVLQNDSENSDGQTNEIITNAEIIRNENLADKNKSISQYSENVSNEKITDIKDNEEQTRINKNVGKFKKPELVNNSKSTPRKRISSAKNESIIIDGTNIEGKCLFFTPSMHCKESEWFLKFRKVYDSFGVDIFTMDEKKFSKNMRDTRLDLKEDTNVSKRARKPNQRYSQDFFVDKKIDKATEWQIKKQKYLAKLQNLASKYKEKQNESESFDKTSVTIECSQSKKIQEAISTPENSTPVTAKRSLKKKNQMNTSEILTPSSDKVKDETTDVSTLLSGKLISEKKYQLNSEISASASKEETSKAASTPLGKITPRMKPLKTMEATVSLSNKETQEISALRSKKKISVKNNSTISSELKTEESKDEKASSSLAKKTISDRKSQINITDTTPSIEESPHKIFPVCQSTPLNDKQTSKNKKLSKTRESSKPKNLDINEIKESEPLLNSSELDQPSNKKMKPTDIKPSKEKKADDKNIAKLSVRKDLLPTKTKETTPIEEVPKKLSRRQEALLKKKEIHLNGPEKHQNSTTENELIKKPIPKEQKALTGSNTSNDLVDFEDLIAVQSIQDNIEKAYKILNKHDEDGNLVDKTGTHHQSNSKSEKRDTLNEPYKSNSERKVKRLGLSMKSKLIKNKSLEVPAKRSNISLNVKDTLKAESSRKPIEMLKKDKTINVKTVDDIRKSTSKKEKTPNDDKALLKPNEKEKTSLNLDLGVKEKKTKDKIASMKEYKSSKQSSLKSNKKNSKIRAISSDSSSDDELFELQHSNRKIQSKEKLSKSKTDTSSKKIKKESRKKSFSSESSDGHHSKRNRLFCDPRVKKRDVRHDSDTNEDKEIVDKHDNRKKIDQKKVEKEKFLKSEKSEQNQAESSRSQEKSKLKRGHDSTTSIKSKNSSNKDENNSVQRNNESEDDETDAKKVRLSDDDVQTLFNFLNEEVLGSDSSIKFMKRGRPKKDVSSDERSKTNSPEKNEDTNSQTKMSTQDGNSEVKKRGRPKKQSSDASFADESIQSIAAFLNDSQSTEAETDAIKSKCNETVTNAKNKSTNEKHSSKKNSNKNEPVAKKPKRKYSDSNIVVKDAVVNDSAVFYVEDTSDKSLIKSDMFTPEKSNKLAKIERTDELPIKADILTPEKSDDNDCAIAKETVKDMVVKDSLVQGEDTKNTDKKKGDAVLLKTGASDRSLIKGDISSPEKKSNKKSIIKETENDKILEDSSDQSADKKDDDESLVKTDKTDESSIKADVLTPEKSDDNDCAMTKVTIKDMADKDSLVQDVDKKNKDKTTDDETLVKIVSKPLEKFELPMSPDSDASGTSVEKETKINAEVIISHNDSQTEEKLESVRKMSTEKVESEVSASAEPVQLNSVGD